MKRLKALCTKGWAGMSDAEKEEWLSGLNGSYNATDLNRVGSAVEYVAGRLRDYGYAAAVNPKKDWTMENFPTPEQMERYLADVETLRSALAVLPTTPETPADMEKLTYTEANNIEKILEDVDLLLAYMAQAWYYSGDVYAGEV